MIPRANDKRPSNGAVVQLVRIHACHAWGRGFESRPHRRGERKISSVNFGFLLIFFRIYILRIYIHPTLSLPSRYTFYPTIRASLMYFAIINGPNLNLLGKRQPEIYGSSTFEDTLTRLRGDLSDYEIKYSQSNSEGDIIDMIQNYGFDSDCLGIVINPGAYAHYSHAIADAIEAVPAPVVEVHISNIYAREEFRHTSVTARASKSIISGCGRDGYLLALLYLTRLFLSNSNPK